MKKRLVAALLLVVMLMSMLAACGGEPVANNPGNTDKPGNTDTPNSGNPDAGTTPGVIGNFQVPEGGYDGSEVTIKFAHTMGAKLQEVLNYHIGEFNKMYPNITIEHSSYGGWGDIAGQINTEIAGDNQPNIAYCYPDHVAMYNLAKSVVILDDLIQSEVTVTDANGNSEVLGLTQAQIDDSIDGFYNEGTAYGDGLMYTMPMSKSTEVLYYNKTFFEENNLTVPTNWDEMEEVCQKILEIDPKCIPLGYDSENNWFITLCEQNNYPYTSATGEHYTFNNDNNKGFVKMLRDWYQKGYVTTEALYGSYTSGLFTELDKNVSHSYMCIGSTGGASYQIPADKAFEVGVAAVPQANASNPKIISQGPSLCILKGGKTTDQQVLASWLFVKYLTTNMAFQTEFSSTSGYMPVLESAQTNEIYAQWLNKANGYEFLTALVVKVGLESADAYFTSPAFNGSTVAREQVGSLLAKCMSESASDVDSLINNAFEDAYDECVFLGG